MPLTDAEKQRRAAEKKAGNGLVRICAWGTPKQKTDIKLYLSGKAKIVRINPRDKYDGIIY